MRSDEFDAALMESDDIPGVAIVDAPTGGYADQLDIETKIIGEAAPIQPYLIPEEAGGKLFEITEPYLVLWHHVGLDAAFFAHHRKCRAVICASVGYNHVDIAAAVQHGVAVYHIPHYGTEEVADHTIALFLAAARRLPTLAAHVADGGWNWQLARGVRRLRDTTWGIVGLGRIGTAVAVRAKAFGMRVAFHDPYNHPGIEKALGVDRRPTLAALLSDSDVVSLHTPLTDETHHLIGAAELGLMRPGSHLVNTARGALVDVAALEVALGTGHLAAAALDVVDGEPELPDWLVTHPRVLLSPHAAFYSVESLVELRTRAATAARELVRGDPVTAAVRVA